MEADASRKVRRHRGVSAKKGRAVPPYRLFPGRFQ